MERTSLYTMEIMEQKTTFHIEPIYKQDNQLTGWYVTAYFEIFPILKLKFPESFKTVQEVVEEIKSEGFQRSFAIRFGELYQLLNMPEIYGVD